MIRLFLFVGTCLAQDLTVTAGADGNQVFQRSASGSASIHLSGTLSTSGKNIEARVTRKGSALKGLNWHSIGSADGGNQPFSRM